MTVDYTRWPMDLAQRYRSQGCWWDLPLTDILDRQKVLRPEDIALICGQRKLSYRELDELSTLLANGLWRQGLQAGDTALIQLPNVAEFYLVFFALLKIGVVPVNALYSHQKMELTSYAKQIQPALLIGCNQHSLFLNRDFINDLRTEVDSLKTILLLGSVTEGESLDALLMSGADVAVDQVMEPPGHTASDVAFFQLSGGSTGSPKLIPRTHNDYYYSVRQSAEVCRLSPQSRYLCVLPAAHNFPLSSPGALGVFYSGGTVIMAPSAEVRECFALVQQHQVTITALVPPLVSLWLKSAEHQREKLSSLKLLQVGGANFAQTLARRIPEELGCRLQQVFGMAEGLVNYTRLDDDDGKVFCTQGCPMSEYDEVRVIDEQGQDVAAGATGMLITRGPYTIRGYYNSPTHNANTFDAQGFYYTGDLVQVDADGYMNVVGRVKDQINRGGEKIAAEEVESLLLKVNAVTHAAVVALPDDALGEKSCACVVVHSESRVSPSWFRRYLREQGIAEYKLPDRFKFFQSLPMTAVGKIDKRTLRLMLDFETEQSF
jgi:2,3-dihydroxybenzoate-AMP ligase